MDSPKSIYRPRFTSSFRQPCTQGAGLQREQARREMRPEVTDTFRDDIEIDPARLDFWSVQPFDLWTELAEGGFGKVFDVAADPDIEVDGRRFRRVAVKVPKPEGVLELTGEVKSLSGLSHPNVVQILGMCFGKTKDSDENHWMAQLEYCSTDLDHLLHGKDAALLRYETSKYTPQLRVKLIREIVAGLCYCHRMGKCHFDLKPDNILLAETPSAVGPAWTAKLAAFGALVNETAGAEKADQHRGSTQAAQWLGTYLWMPPKATGLNTERGYPKGRICVEPDEHTVGSQFGSSDWFSFGIMLWEMLEQELPHAGLGEAFSEELIAQVWVNDSGCEDRSLNPDDYTDAARSGMTLHPLTDSKGHWAQDFRAVAKAYFNGNRPEIPGDCPPLLSKLMIACWQDKQQDRPTSSFMQRLTDQLPAEQWLEPPGEAISYAEFLEQLGLADKEDELAEYLSEPGAELTELKQMEPEDLDEDVLNDDELGFDEDTKARFRAAVIELRDSSGCGGEAGKGEKPADACAALEAVARLPTEVQTVESMQKLLDSTAAENNAVVAEKDKLIAELEAKLDALG